MDFFKAVAKRYSYRGEFKKNPIPKKDLLRIVQAGMAAPSGKNAQTTIFVVVNKPKLIKKIGSMHTMAAMQTAKAMIVCVVDKNPQPVYEGYSFQIEDCAAAAENMLLAITALGYSSVWIDGWLRLEGRAQIIANLLQIPDDKIVKVILPVGMPKAKLPRKEKKPFKERAWFNKYHNKGKK